MQASTANSDEEFCSTVKTRCSRRALKEAKNSTPVGEIRGRERGKGEEEKEGREREEDRLERKREGQEGDKWRRKTVAGGGKDARRGKGAIGGGDRVGSNWSERDTQMYNNKWRKRPMKETVHCLVHTLSMYEGEDIEFRADDPQKHEIGSITIGIDGSTTSDTGRVQTPRLAQISASPPTHNHVLVRERIYEDGKLDELDQWITASDNRVQVPSQSHNVL